MSEVNVNEIEINSNEGVNQELNDLHYIGVMFEDRYNSSVTNPKFYGRVYEYKTRKPLREGEVITIETNYGMSRVCVVKENIKKEDLEYFDVDNIKEI